MSRKTYPRDRCDSEWLIVAPFIPAAKPGGCPRRNDALREVVREHAGREAEPSAAIVDRQRVKTTETTGERGHDAHKKVTGRKRHLLVDVMGLLLAVVVHAADIQDRAGAKRFLQRAITTGCARLQLIWADGGATGTDYEQLPETSEALIYAAMSRVMLTRLARQSAIWV